MTLHDLSGKVALITGIGAITKGWGNGVCITTLLARQGATIFGCDINLAAADDTKAIVEGEGHQITTMYADVTKASSVQVLVDACVAKHGRIDILVNNVGKPEPGGPVDLSEHIWDSQMDVNLKSVYLTTKAALPIMERQGSGSVVNISSIAGIRDIGKPHVGYSASKAAVIQFTKTTSIIYAKKGVRLNSVLPGLIDTPLVRSVAQQYNINYEDYCATRDLQVPMGRQGEGWDVAHAVLFLVSDEAKYITGQELVVDGGLTVSTGRE